MSNHFTTIHTYTRQQALSDGVLVDATAMAKEAGFRIPVALTAAAWARCVTVPPDVECQDEPGRLWDVLTMLRFTVEPGKGDGSELRFRVCVQTLPDSGPEIVSLKAVCGPDDDGAPCVTVMLPDED